MSPVLIRFETDGLPRVIDGTIASASWGFFTLRGRAGLDVYTVSGAVELDVFSKAPCGEIALVGFALRFDHL